MRLYIRVFTWLFFLCCNSLHSMEPEALIDPEALTFKYTKKMPWEILCQSNYGIFAKKVYFNPKDSDSVEPTKESDDGFALTCDPEIVDFFYSSCLDEYSQSGEYPDILNVKARSLQSTRKKFLYVKKSINPGQTFYLQHDRQNGNFLFKNTDSTHSTFLESSKLNNAIVIGDTHGSAIRIINTLIEAEVISVPGDLHDQLKTYYRKNDVESFSSMLNAPEVSKNDENKIKYIYFVGDLLADRGVNDLMTLLVLKFLTEKGFDYEVALSNHDAEFISQIDNMNCSDYLKISNVTIAPHQSSSLHGLKSSLKKICEPDSDKAYKEINIEDIRSLIDEYTNHLVLISYFFTTHGTASDSDSAFYIITHAPLNQSILKDMKEFLENSKSRSKTDLKSTFRFLPGYFDLLKKFDKDNKETKFIINFIWNRDLDSDPSDKKCTGEYVTKGVKSIVKKFNKELYDSIKGNITHIHGHNKKGQLYENSVNLNSSPQSVVDFSPFITLTVENEETMMRTEVQNSQDIITELKMDYFSESTHT